MIGFGFVNANQADYRVTDTSRAAGVARPPLPAGQPRSATGGTSAAPVAPKIVTPADMNNDLVTVLLGGLR